MVDVAARIVVDPNVMSGKPIIRGTRVTVERVLTLLAQGMTKAQVLGEFPQIGDPDILACLAYGASLAGSEEIVPLPENRPA